MLPKKKESGQLCLFFSFADTLSQKHPLYIFQRVFHTFYRLAGYFFFTKKIKMTFSGTTTYGSLSGAEITTIWFAERTSAGSVQVAEANLDTIHFNLFMKCVSFLHSERFFKSL